MRYLVIPIFIATLTSQLVATPLSFSVSTHKSVYWPDEIVRVTITARNHANIPDTMWFSTGCQTDYHIDSLDYRAHDSIGFMCVHSFTTRIVSAHDSIQWEDEEWAAVTGARLGPGRHAIVAQVRGYYASDQWTSDTLWITVQTPTGAGGDANILTTFELGTNYPNPFNPSTSISYTIPRHSSVRLQVLNLLGQLVETLFDQDKEPGTYNVKFDASSLPSGVYFYRLQSGEFVETKTMLLMR